MLHKALQNKWVRVLIAVFATFLYALGVNLFIVPMGLYSCLLYTSDAADD